MAEAEHRHLVDGSGSAQYSMTSIPALTRSSKTLSRCNLLRQSIPGKHVHAHTHTRPVSRVGNAPVSCLKIGECALEKSTCLCDDVRYVCIHHSSQESLDTHQTRHQRNTKNGNNTMVTHDQRRPYFTTGRCKYGLSSEILIIIFRHVAYTPSYSD